MFLEKTQLFKKFVNTRTKIKRISQSLNPRYLMNYLNKIFEEFGYYYDFQFDEKSLFVCGITYYLNGEQYAYLTKSFELLLNQDFKKVFEGKIIKITENNPDYLKDITEEDIYIPATNQKLNIIYNSFIKIHFKKIQKEIEKDNIKIMSDKLKELLIKKDDKDDKIILNAVIEGTAKKENGSNN